MLCSKLRPTGYDVPIVLRRRGQPGAVVDTIVVEEHAKYFMTLGQRRLGERKRLGNLEQAVATAGVADEQMGGEASLASAVLPRSSTEPTVPQPPA